MSEETLRYCTGHVFAASAVCQSVDARGLCREHCGHAHPGTIAARAALTDELVVWLREIVRRFDHDELVEDDIVLGDATRALLARADSDALRSEGR